LLVSILLTGALPLTSVPAAAQAPVVAADSYADQVTALMADMTALDRVGQLFLVVFVGDTAPPGTLIAGLIQDYRVGGVVLLTANSNITDTDNPPAQIANLVNELQTRAHEASLEPRLAAPEETGPPGSPPFVPLFIGLDHEGDGYPYTRILSGLTQIPNNMAVGATWRPEHAETVGRVVGTELAALGINLLLGPSLDVLEFPRAGSTGGLGTRSFGGDPYWVGLMGQSYIRGVHQASQDRIIVVGKHFPGHGGSDRQPDREVSTVRKSLEQLKQIELAPFFVVTGDAPGQDGVTDALMTSHIRYQGLQGNIRESTRPISFDPQALDSILRLPEFAGWRAQGGLIVSDSLGVRAVKRFYDPELAEFPHRQIALDAFLAGNDILTLSEFAASTSYPDQVANIKDTIDWFRSMYSTDMAFQARVDAAVRRILQAKLRLYGGPFSLDSTLVDLEQVGKTVGKMRDLIVPIAQDSITLLAPAAQELADQLTSPPEKSDRIVIFTDERTARQCSTCARQPYVSVTALQEAILRLYGPTGTNQVLAGNLNSFSFLELKSFLAQPEQPPATPTATPDAESTPETTPETTPAPPLIQTALRDANWIVFAMLDVVPEQPQSDAVTAFLSERPDISAKARVIVLAFNAPYYLDTTDVSKLTAYYGIYSKIGPFIDTAAKALFKQITPRGASPVSIPGTGYDLIEITSPAAGQIIQLFYGQEPTSIPEAGTLTPTPPGPTDLRVGHLLQLRTGVIVDHNGNPVPDGTPVQFTISYLAQGLGFDVPQPEVPTTNGVARIEILLDRPGQLQIKASSGDARASVGLAVTVFEDQPAIIEAITPTPTQTPTPLPATPTPTATSAPPTETPTAAPTPTYTPLPIAVPYVPHEPRSDFAGLALALVGLVGVGLFGLKLGQDPPHGTRVRAVRLCLTVVTAGLVGYNYSALALPGADLLRRWLGSWSAPALALAAGLATLIISALSQPGRADSQR